MYILVLDTTTTGGTGRIMIIGDMAGILGAFMTGTALSIMEIITTVGLSIIHTVITIMEILITMVTTMAIMFTAEEAFHIARPDEIVYPQITVQIQPKTVMQILRFTIRLEEAEVPIQTP